MLPLSLAGHKVKSVDFYDCKSQVPWSVGVRCLLWLLFPPLYVTQLTGCNSEILKQKTKPENMPTFFESLC